MNIAVAGLGVAGGAVATALARAGHRVTVFEQAGQPGPVGAGFLLQPSGRAALDRLGLLAAVTASSHPIRKFIACKRPGRVLTELGMDARGVARGVLFSALRDAAVSAGAVVVPGVRVEDFFETEDAVTPRDAAGRSLGRFDLLLGADGARSAIRAKLNPGYGIALSSYGALWAIGDGDGLCREELRQEARGTRILSGLLPVGSRTQTFFWGLRGNEYEPLKSAGFAAFRDRVGAVFPEAVPVLENIGGFDAMTFSRYGFATARRLHTRRTVLLGDAAHAMSPHLGQGANLALLDALALGDALGANPDPAAAFSAYARARRRQNLFYAGLSRRLSPFFQSDFAPLGLVRDVALPMMGAVPPLRGMMERTLSGARDGWLG